MQPLASRRYLRVSFEVPFECRLQPEVAGVDARKATPRLGPPHWGLAGNCQLDPSHPPCVTCRLMILNHAKKLPRPRGRPCHHDAYPPILHWQGMSRCRHFCPQSVCCAGCPPSAPARFLAPSTDHRAHTTETLANQLGGKHFKRAEVVLGVLKHRPSTAKVCPSAIFAHHTDEVADARGAVRDQRSSCLGNGSSLSGGRRAAATATGLCASDHSGFLKRSRKRSSYSR